ALSPLIYLSFEYRTGKTLTTDAIYRETPGRRKHHLTDGCDVVEVEATAFFTMVQFREVVLGQVVYGGDLVMDGRGWHKRKDDQNIMFGMAVKAALLLKKKEAASIRIETASFSPTTL
ncbi:MAG TPA: hypothetical protein P5282_06170, partial [Anaerolineaceae bacterium]|nr:hypothetical protein [Anaerolineaceae bacterium]